MLENNFMQILFLRCTIFIFTWVALEPQKLSIFLVSWLVGSAANANQQERYALNDGLVY